MLLPVLRRCSGREPSLPARRKADRFGPPDEHEAKGRRPWQAEGEAMADGST